MTVSKIQQVIEDILDPSAATSPSVTTSVPNAGSSISSSTLHLPVNSGAWDSNYRYYGSFMASGSGTLSNYVTGANTITSALGIMGLSFRVGFGVYGDKFEILTGGQGKDWRIRVDGKLVASGTFPDANAYRLLVDFTNAGGIGFRRILFEVENGGYFGGVQIPTIQAIYPEHHDKGSRMLVTGDSWSDGTGSDRIRDWAYTMGQLLGYRDVFVGGIGGTGYLQDSSLGSHLRARMTDFQVDAPDIMVIAAGTNDAANYTSSQVGSEASTLYSQLKTNLPNTKFAVLGPWPVVGAQSDTTGKIPAIDSAIQSACSSNGIPFFSPVQQKWITGTGYVGHENGSGSADKLISSDGIHPSQDGHDFVGRWGAYCLSSIGL